MRPSLITLAAVLALATSARAHIDPPGCFQTGPAIIVSVFEKTTTACTTSADCSPAFPPGTPCLTNLCSPGLIGNVSECENIRYRATLQKADPNDDTICAFAGGTFKLTTPDGVVHDISLNVPCIGGNTGLEGCLDSVNSLVSDIIDYTVKPADVVGGLITATAQYAGGSVHDSTNNTGGVSATTPKSTPVTFCNDNDLCTTDTCDPNVHGANACGHTAVVCDDQNACTADTCNPANGLCVFTPNVVCNDNNACTNDVCDPATGLCVFTPNVVCNDNNACTDDTCNPANGQCVFTPNVVCNDDNLCTDDSCNPANGQCVFTPNKTCNDNNICTTDTCNPATGLCVFTPTLDCDDHNVCTTDTCDPVLGCQHSPPPSCDDNNPCTDDSCNPTLGCQNVPNNNPACAVVHFQCYEIKPFAFGRKTVNVQDRYANGSVSIRSPDRLCAPSDKRGENPGAVSFPEHLAGYPSLGSSPRASGQTVANQFGTVKLDVIRRSFLLVPTAKSLTPPPPPPLQNPVTDHFECYLVRRSIGQPNFTPIRGVSAADQFGTHAMDLLRPRYLCVPANKADEDPGALSHTQNLLCYKARQRASFGTVPVGIDDQFGPAQVELTRRLEFCVPSTLVTD